MKKYFMKFICMVLSVCVLLTSNVIAFANVNDSVADSVENEYVYEITQDSQEWSSILSHQDMIDVCQISENEIKQMNTLQLLNAVLDYPLLLDIYTYDSIEMGVSALRD